jgi:AcrR family transcriptional regulator
MKMYRKSIRVNRAVESAAAAGDMRRMNADETLSPRHVDLLDQLERIFFARGYRAVTMDDLAQALRCSKRALYELAPNRKALFLMVVERWTGRVRDLGVAGAAGHDDPRDRLAAFLQPGVAETEALTEEFLADLRDLPAARDTLEQHQRDRMAMLRDIVAEGVRRGRFKPVHAHLVAGICLAGMARINDPEFLREAGLSFSQAFAELYRMLMTGIAEDRPG